jgi:hypothetical protein
MPHVTATGAPRSQYSLTDDLVEPAETREVRYRCPAGHTFAVRLFAGAEVVPREWDCRACPARAHTDDPTSEPVPVSRRAVGRSKPPWQQLRERRSIAELEVLLEERLRLLRAVDAAA